MATTTPAATPSNEPDKKAPAAEPEKKTRRVIAPVAGPMTDPLTGIRYGTDPLIEAPETIKLGSWLHSQIDAGKLVITEL